MSRETKRRASNKERVLEALKHAGKMGLTNVSLIPIGGIRYGARIWELGREGYEIATIPVQDGVFRYVYQGRRDERQERLFV